MIECVVLLELRSPGRSRDRSRRRNRVPRHVIAAPRATRVDGSERRIWKLVFSDGVKDWDRLPDLGEESMRELGTGSSSDAGGAPGETAEGGPGETAEGGPIGGAT